MFKQINRAQILLTLIFVGLAVWWASFQHVVTKQGPSAQWFEGTYGLVALTGAIIGFLAARKWGGFKTVLGRSLVFFSMGLLAQEAGQLIYQYYIYKEKIAIPYPSWGDVAYFGSVLLYIVAALYLHKAAGAGFSLKHSKNKAIAVIVPAILLALSFGVLLHGHKYDTSKPLTVFLDLGYPIAQATYISIATTAYILSRKVLGGVMRSGILLVILALFIQYIADFTFVYQNSRGTYVAGKFDDLFYLISYFAMATAMIRFHTIYNGIKAKTQTVSTESSSPASPNIGSVGV